MKKFLYVLLALMGAAIVPGQANAQDNKQCGSSEANERMLEKYPELRSLKERYDSLVYSRHASQRSVDSTTIYVIPIVFHVIHNYGPENISDEQIYDAVRILNEDYRKLNADTSSIITQFKDIAADCRIEFRLAQRDPHGKCTNGIDRIRSIKTYAANDDAKLDPWPRDYYLNIWVVSKMPDGVAGYAYLPPSVGNGLSGLVDGVLILSDYIGSIGTSSPNTSRALTHEIGHCLNLQHPWGSTNQPGVACGDDGIFDTPITKGWDHCPSPNSARVCDANIVENYQNYMDYSYCSKMFTKGQRDAMRTALESPVAGRSSLWTEQNLRFTGTDVSSPFTCSPVADFFTKTRMVCQGEQVKFTDVSWRGNISSRVWNAKDANVTTTNNDSIAEITFNNVGWQNVSLTVTDVNGSDSIQKSEYVYVSPGFAAYNGTYSESFENPSVLENDWVVFNEDNNKSIWQRTDKAALTGNASVMLGNFENDYLDQDELISPAIDLSQTTGTKYFFFSYTSATTTSQVTQMKDSLKLSYSTDCGHTWVSLANVKGPALVNGGGYDWQAYAPKDRSFWSTFSTPLPQGALTGNVRFRFQFISSGSGNNVYLDDINIADYNGIDNPTAQTANMALYPNPTSSSVQLSYSLEKSADVSVELYDVMGQRISVLAQGSETAGDHLLTFNDGSNGQQLANGVYFVRLTADGKAYTRRLVVVQ